MNGGLHNAGKVRVVMSTVSINGGNSGGPLMNEAGELVGVNSYTVLRGWTGREVANTSGHISVKEFTTYFAEVDKLVSPKTAEQFVARGERKLKAGRTDAAIKDFSAALGKDDQCADALFLRGKAFTQNGDPRTGLEDLSAAIKLDGAKYEYRVARGQAQRALGKTDEAMTDFSVAIRTDPAKSEGYNERGITTYRAGKYVEAEDDFARAIDKLPTDAVLWANRGDARFALKKYKEAAEDFAKAADLDPTNTGYVTALGNSLVNAGKPRLAVELFVEAAQKFGNPVFLNRAGNALLTASDNKAAVKVYSDAIKAFGDKGDPFEVGMAYQGRGVAQRELKNFKEAIDDCTKAIDLHAGKNGYDYLHRGLAYRANGQANAAEDDFAAAEKLGVKVERKGQGADTPAADSIVGKWAMTCSANGVTISQVIEFNADGTWEGSTTLSTQYGSETKSDTGTWKLNREKDKLTVRGKATGTVVRTISLDGDEADIDMTELGVTVTFKRVK